EPGVHDLVAVRGRKLVRIGHLGALHHHLELGAQSLLVELHRFGAGAVEEKIGIDLGHGGSPGEYEKQPTSVGQMPSPRVPVSAATSGDPCGAGRPARSSAAPSTAAAAANAAPTANAT